jgi:hypothetical protein
LMRIEECLSMLVAVQTLDCLGITVHPMQLRTIAIHGSVQGLSSTTIFF